MHTSDLYSGQWDAAAFFERLAALNRLALAEGFTFCRVSGLEGFEEAIAQMQTRSAFLCVSDIADGYTELNNSPRTRRVKTVFLAMRHAVDDMDARSQCMETMRELFRQLMSRLILEKTRLEENCIFIDSRISFNEIDRYFFSGCACAYFQIAVDVYTDLRVDKAEWNDLVPKYDLWIINPAPYKVRVIKYLRDITGMGLAEAKAIVDNPPFILVPSVVLEEAQPHVEALEELTVTYQLLPHGQVPAGT